MSQFIRTEMLLGSNAMAQLQAAHVIVFGVGGVGGFAAEALVRAGIGSITLVDNDTIAPSNLNRQIIALHSTLGRSKVQVMAQRLQDINPHVRVTCHELFYLPENADAIDLSAFDYIIDAVDTVAAKLEIITRAHRLGVPVISAMGAGNKLDPTKIVITDISQTHTCPLARVIRAQCKKRGIRRLKVAYSTEPALRPTPCNEPSDRRATPGSVSFVPSVMGLVIAGEVVRTLAAEKTACTFGGNGV